MSTHAQPNDTSSPPIPSSPPSWEVVNKDDFVLVPQTRPTRNPRCYFVGVLVFMCPQCGKIKKPRISQKTFSFRCAGCQRRWTVGACLFYQVYGRTPDPASRNVEPSVARYWRDLLTGEPFPEVPMREMQTKQWLNEAHPVVANSQELAKSLINNEWEGLGAS